MGCYYDKLEYDRYIKAFESLKNNINESYQELSNLLDSVENGEWSGKSRDAMVAFLDLMKQYHGTLAGEGGHIEKGYNCLKGLGETIDSIDDDYTEYDNVRRL